MSFLAKIFAGGIKETVDSVGKVIDGLHTSADEKLTAKNNLAQIITSKFDSLASYQRDVLTTELSGSKLQRNWRPFTALSFVFLIMYAYFIQPVIGSILKAFTVVELVEVPLPSQIWTLMTLMITGYVASRGIEKVADTFSKGVDMTFLKKKDRA